MEERGRREEGGRERGKKDTQETMANGTYKITGLKKWPSIFGIPTVPVGVGP